MKKLFISFLFVFSILFGSSAEASFLYSPYDKPYVSLRYANILARSISVIDTDLSYAEKSLSWGYLPSFALAGGYSFGYNPMRVELELSGLTMFSDIQDIDFDSTRLSADLHTFNATNFLLATNINIYFDHVFSEYLSIYTGGGVGSAIPFLYVRSNTSSLKLLKPTMPKYQWNLTIGASIKLDKNLYFDLGYKYVDIPSGLPSALFVFDNNNNVNLTTDGERKKFNMSQIVLGLRYML